MLQSSLLCRHSSLMSSACGPSRTAVTSACTGTGCHSRAAAGLLSPRQQQERKRCLVVQQAESTSDMVTLQYWKEKGCDLMKSGITAELRDQIITYGELVQAAYDNLGQDLRHPEQYGNAVRAPEELLSYLQGNYRLAQPPTSNGNGNGVAAAKTTFDRYMLPAVREDGLSPLFEGLPGKAAGEASDKRPWSKLMGLEGLMSVRMTLWDKICTTVPALAIKFIEGTSPLFGKGDLGRGTKPRGTFFGYVALSEPGETGSAEDAPRDVALVWRGTIFKEEWESNFCEDQLDVWGTGDCAVKIVPRAHEVGVHAGFCDLYTRPVHNPNPLLRQGVGAGGVAPPPREGVHKWLTTLMEEHNITTITATGHSLGGGLATLCAYDVARWLQGFDDWPKTGWKTTKRPTVRMVTFAAPRAGNAAFVEHFHTLGIQALRVENKGDVVPDVPGIFVQGITVAVETIDRIFGGAARVDMTSDTVTKWRRAYQGLCSLPLLDNFYRRNPRSLKCRADSLEEPTRKGKTEGGDSKKGSKDKYEGIRWLQPLFGLHVWGFFHVGQVLKLSPTWAKVAPTGWQPLSEPSEPQAPFLKKLGLGQKHNLELYIYLVSLLNPAGPPTGPDAGAAATRNPLLLNKSDDILGEEKLPASWWGEADKRGCIQIDGRWVFVGQAAPGAEAQKAAAPAATPESNSDLQQLQDQLQPAATEGSA